MNSEMTSIDVETIIEKIKHAEKTVVLSGAGVSTSAGIPDYRGPEGLYTTGRYSPDEVFDIKSLCESPELFYSHAWEFLTFRRSVTPSLTHNVLAALEKNGYIQGVITQNIDGLHQQAGSKSVLEVHGSYRSVHCTGCEYRNPDVTTDWWIERMKKNRRHIAQCALCGEVLKPGVVFFGEPVQSLWQAESLAKQADLMLVIGSSLSVYPVSLLPQAVDGDVIIINQGPVAWTGHPKTFHLSADLDWAFAQIAEKLALS